ncbi:MAG TPA: ATP-binding protein [Candidatus Avamphibacillus sp.]|nr:ATP-binding protein [Candidatus Avamphibacillus sp.]
MKRDVAIVPLNEEEELVIAADNSGSIGMREQDDVQVPYDVVAYYNFRVAWMECVAAGAEPFSIVIHNFSGDGAWEQLIKGIHRGMNELDIDNLEITGSTETNFTLVQSAIGMAVIGRRKKERPRYDEQEKVKIAVIGEPLVGNEVIENEANVAPLDLFKWFAEQKNVLTLIPVGSKGILYELEQLFAGKSLEFTTDLDLKKTSGPATCFIVAYKETVSKTVKEKAANLFHEVIINLTFAE